MIQAMIAVYPLQQSDYDAVHRALRALRSARVEVHEGTMSTTIAGTEPVVFDALRAAYEAAAECGPTVMTVTLSNACPLPAT